MATYKFILFAGNERKDGSFPVSIRITKERKSKLIRTGLVSTKEQWNESDGRFVSDKRIVPKFIIKNIWPFCTIIIQIMLLCNYHISLRIR